MASSDAPTAPLSADADPPPGVGSGDRKRQKIDEPLFGQGIVMLPIREARRRRICRA